MNKTREYIISNPLNWELDLENPLVQSNPMRRQKGTGVEKEFSKELKLNGR